MFGLDICDPGTKKALDLLVIALKVLEQLLQDYIATGAFVYGALECAEKYGALEASRDLRPPSLLPVCTKQCRAAVGGAKPQVDP